MLQFKNDSCLGVEIIAGNVILLFWPDGGLTATYFSCFSDDSDDSDGALGTRLSLDPSTQHPALTVKTEPCEQGDGLAEGKPLNGVLLQSKGKINPKHSYLCYSHVTTHAHPHLCHLTVEGRCSSCTFVSCDVFSLPVNSTDQKADKTSFYNFSKLKKNRKWLKVFHRLMYRGKWLKD